MLGFGGGCDDATAGYCYDPQVSLSGSDDGDWHHYCLTYDGTDWLLYFDGTVAHTETEALNTGSDNPLTLGVRNSGGYTGYSKRILRR